MKKTTEIVSRLISDEILLETKSGNVKISTDEDGKLNIGSLYIPGNENTLIVDPVNNCVTASCLSVGVISASQYIGPIGGGGGGSPASPNNSVQFNNGGSFGGSSNLTFNPSTNILSGTQATFVRITGSFSGSGRNITNVTASNISNFANDVRSQFSAGTNITIVGGVISTTGGGGTPGGTNTTIQFNSGSTFSGSTQLIYNYTNNILSGTTAQFTTLSASNVLIFGTASLFTNPQSAYIVYNSGSDKLVAFPGLIVTGSITGSESISAVTISGTTAQFTTLSASNIYISSSGNAIIDVSSSVSALRITQRGSGESIRVEDSTNPDSTPFIIDVNGNVGIGTSAPTFQLQLSTDSAAKPSTNTWTISSDIRVKENIQNYSKGLNILNQLNPVTYDYNGKAGFNSQIKNNIGLIAQDIINIIPESISTYRTKLNPEDTEDIELYNFNSHALTYIIINSIKELTNEIQQLKNQIQVLQSGSI